jgi:hypothetical protein
MNHSFFLYILRQPTETIAIALSHNHWAHENLNWADIFQWNLALKDSIIKEGKIVNDKFRGIWIKELHAKHFTLPVVW